ncbi:Aste57867_8711 [Aphanomyces stellatus]|uniref:Aste57867_8711 protein n=1 Tax=Aphanomyces stellatus TaxID=120398 RepID=A0A485KL22_9STRA|nr:hypothetical protein As57867_008677 [Aphanomyces stellatus]VFT85597.1 Aste57867_8711 [Aphanomyces stellatus]
MGCCHSVKKSPAVYLPPSAAQPATASTPSSHVPSSPSFVSELPRRRRASRSPMVFSRVHGHFVTDPGMHAFYNHVREASACADPLAKITKKSSCSSRSTHRDVMSIFGEKGFILESSHIASDVNTPTSSISSSVHQPTTPTAATSVAAMTHSHYPTLSIAVGSASIAGRRAINEDRVACHVDAAHPDTKDVGFFAVYDGHGGANVSQYLSDHLHKTVFAQVESHPTETLDSSLQAAMLATDCTIYDNAINHGSTAIAMLLDGTHMAFASLGDSQAILCSNDGRDVVDLCHSHRPTTASERDRILSARGSIVDGRIFGVLGVSRAFGDNDLKTSKGAFKDKFNGDVVGSQPDVRLHALRPDDEFVVLACDGIFDVLSPEQLVGFIRSRLSLHQDVQVAADEAAAHAMRLGSTDNLSVVIVRFHQP